MELLSLSIGVRGERAVSRRLGLLSSAIGDMTHVFRKSVHPFMIKHSLKQFETAGAHGGEKWPGYENEPKYRGSKKAMVGHLEVLRWERGNERLFPSIVARTHPEHVFRSTAKTATFGTRVPYAKRLNEGGIGPFDEKYPPRKIFAMTRGQKKELITTIQRAILEEVGASGIQSARVI